MSPEASRGPVIPWEFCPMQHTPSITSTSAPHNPPLPRQLWHFLLIGRGPGMPSALPAAILAARGHRSLGAWPGACTFDLEQCSQINKISPRAGVRFWSS